MGTLLDCTKHDWAPPRFCESPTSDIEGKNKNTRGKRVRNNLSTDPAVDARTITSKLRNGKGRRTANSGYISPSPAKSDSSVNLCVKRKGRPNEGDMIEETIKRNRPYSETYIPSSPALIECPEPNCSKKYKHINGLKYHQSHAHTGSTFNVNDSQDSEVVQADSNKGGDISDGELTESFNITENGLKDSTKNVQKSSDDNNLDDQTEHDLDDTRTNSQIIIHSETGANEENSSTNENENNSNSLLNNLPKNNEATDSTAEAFENQQMKFSDLTNSNILSNQEESMDNPASSFSDISEDNDDSTMPPVPSTSSQSVGHSSITELSKESPSSSKSDQKNNGSFNIHPFPYFKNKLSNFASTNDSKSKDLVSDVNSASDVIIPPNTAEPSSYSQYPFFFGSRPNQDLKSNSQFDGPLTSSNSPKNTNKKDCDLLSKDKLHSIKQQQPKECSPSKQLPIVELQNLKNRISNFAFDQSSSIYDIPKQRHTSESDKSREMNKMKQQPSKSSSTPKEKDKKSAKDEGVKPTMETTGPPPPTNGFYYNPSFLSSHFNQFESVFRNNSPMSMLNPSFVPGHGQPFLHSQMRFPMINPLDSLSMSAGSSLSRTTTTQSLPSGSSASTSAKPPNPMSSFSNNSNKQNDRGHLLSPPTSVSNVLPANYASMPYHKSPIKADHASSSNEQQRTSQAPVNPGFPPNSIQQRPGLVGYPMFDPYNGMFDSQS